MKLDWHRANEITSIETENNPNFYHFRPVYYPTPVLRQDISTLLDYESDSELGVSLAIAWRCPSPEEGMMYYYPELLLKRLPWVIKNLCEKTDIQQERCRIIATVDTALRELAEPYLEECQFPEDHVNWLESRESIIGGCFNKFEAASHSIFRETQKILHLDLSFHIGSHPSQWGVPMFSRIKSEWTTQCFASYFPLFKPRSDYANCITPMRFYDEKRDRLIQRFAQFLGHSELEERRYWADIEDHYHFQGGLLGMSRELLDGDFVRDMERLMEKATDEEALVVYARYKGWQQSDVANFDYFFAKTGVDLNPQMNCEATIHFVDRSFPLDVWLSLHD